MLLVRGCGPLTQLFINVLVLVVFLVVLLLLVLGFFSFLVHKMYSFGTC